MGQVQAWECDGCKNIIIPSKNPFVHGPSGYIINGTISVAEGDGTGGLIGSGKFGSEGDKPMKVVLCHHCFITALDLKVGTLER